MQNGQIKPINAKNAVFIISLSIGIFSILLRYYENFTKLFPLLKQVESFYLAQVNLGCLSMLTRQGLVSI
jgi:hypothetical protein